MVVLAGAGTVDVAGVDRAAVLDGARVRCSA